MNDPVALLVYAVPALLWMILAEDAWRFRLSFRPHNQLYRLLPLAATSFACFYLVFIAAELSLPGTSTARAPRWYELTDVAMFAAISLFRHMAWYFRLAAQTPSRSWLAVNYGSAALLALLSVFPEIIPAPTIELQVTIARAPIMPYVIIMLALSMRHIRTFALPGGWRTGGSAVARKPDLAVIAITLVAAIAMYMSIALVVGVEPTTRYVRPNPILNSAIGVIVALPFAIRILGDVVKRFLLVTLVVAAAGVTFLFIDSIVARIGDPALRSFAGFASILALTGLLLMTHDPLCAAIDALLFRRHRQRRAELHAFVQTLSPELGAVECCRRAVEQVVRVMHIRGAAIVLTRNRGAVAAGDLDVSELGDIWQTVELAGPLPDRPFSLGTFRELPVALQEVLVKNEIGGMMALKSPRQYWGVAVATAGPLGATFGSEDLAAIQHLGDQLALILDGTELLDRVVAVERSLAHAGKLAALGEMSARIAHEIRNPVTAARSLAQQLQREPRSPFHEEHGLILTELQRIERQIAALLRFARREEFRFEAVDLGRLVELTVAEARTKLQAAGIHVETQLGSEIVASADGEKLRQVLINLIENAADALKTQAEKRSLLLTVSASNGCGVMRVKDTGPGIAADLLDKIFEPFFSRKENGTGLGLAIAQKTIEAHGGTIGVMSEPGIGTTFDIRLPLTKGGSRTTARESSLPDHPKPLHEKGSSSAASVDGKELNER